uniref:hypothetical protein n=1 Tax=Hydrocytium acuminatum TaxID=1745963 RepID=UPI002A819DA6|nr:hypothetical protein UYM18_pgp092 [Hydrocytium acuminatum]WOR09526.1 hypothetical protein [Hydrocytium acuminatum]
MKQSFQVRLKTNIPESWEFKISRTGASEGLIWSDRIGVDINNSSQNAQTDCQASDFPTSQNNPFGFQKKFYPTIKIDTSSYDWNPYPYRDMNLMKKSIFTLEFPIHDKLNLTERIALVVIIHIVVINGIIR